MTYYIKTKDKNPRYLVRSIICTRRKKIGTDEEYVNEDSLLQPKLKDIELEFLNKLDQVVADQDLQDKLLPTGKKSTNGINNSGEKTSSTANDDLMQEKTEEKIPDLRRPEHDPDNSDNKSDNDALVNANTDKSLPIEEKGWDRNQRSL
eukprot:3578653-Ditylum_brightwellii.AAC.1